ncbi:MAG: exonuclease domain-containing protein [Enterobacteriaceae bacterium]
MNTYVSIDVETANPNLSSICQIGLAKFRDGQCIDERMYYVNPEEYFDRTNIFIHGIDESTVAGAPTFRELHGELLSFFGDDPVCSHTRFDRSSLWQACGKYGLPTISNIWIDSAKIARRSWEFCRQKGYGLKNLCNHFNIEITHHDALSDAKAAGTILHKAMSDSSLSLQEIIALERRPLSSRSSGSGTSSFDPKNYVINEAGHLYGEAIVFTGALCMTRNEAAQLAAQCGCEVHSGVKKDTTLLVVGTQNEAFLAGHEKSSKHRKAEELIGKGQPMRIITETDFMNMLEIENTPT